MVEIDKEWTAATLTDTVEALEEIITRLSRVDDVDPVYAQDVREELLKVYAKLNFVYNTMTLGDQAFDVLDDDQLIGIPESLPFVTTPDVKPETEN